LKIENDLKESEVKICVIIATRNRPEMLSKLLESIVDNQVGPDLISIVSSGVEIESTIVKFKDKLKIEHIHTNKSGQVLQRNLALESIKEIYDAYSFLDDDVIVDQEFFSKIGLFITKSDDLIGGIGVNLEREANVLMKNSIVNRIGKYFKSNHFSGKVLRSGRGVKYIGNESIKQVAWLNGLSIWTHPVISNFKHVPMGNRYAAAEDLIFSYKVGKVYKLYYNPEIKVKDQNSEKDNPPNLDIYRTSWQHRLYFVLTNRELNFWLYILDNIFSLIILMVSVIRGNTKVKFKIIIYNVRFLYLIIKNYRQYRSDTEHQLRLLQEIL
jgi:glycosyltransferase involved in cell wall biosynthesis